jgi:integrase
LEIEDWLSGLKDNRTGANLSPLSRGNYARAIGVAFSYAVRRGYATANPKIDKPAAVTGDVGILTVTEAARLLESATTEVLPYIAIGLFAGLRRAELQRLDWSEIDFESGLIEVTAEKSKTAQKRFVMLQPNLREWLQPVRKHKGKVTPDEPAFRRAFEQARKAAGIAEWPDNALRHSFASYHLAHFKNAASTALEMGHHDSRVTFTHYRELVKPKEAERYWKIFPMPVSKVVPMTSRSR